MLYFIGLGLSNERDVTLRGLDAIQSSTSIYLETYTSILTTSKTHLEKLYQKPIIEADRDFVEENADTILTQAKTSIVSFLVVGDPFSATTHSDLWLRAKEQGIKVKIIHNASIMNAISSTGLQSYRFGEAISLPFFTETWKPTSFYEKLIKNYEGGLHTLVLLDIKVKEPTVESLARGGPKKYMEPRFMSVNQGLEQLLEVERVLKKGVLGKESLVVGVARLGADDEMIVAGKVEEVMKVEFGKELHSIVVPAKDLHFHESQVLDTFRL